MKRIVNVAETRQKEKEKESRPIFKPVIKTDTRKKFESYEDLYSFEGPYNDTLDLHVHRFETKIQGSLICSICNKKIENLTLTSTHKTSIYDLDNRYLQEHLKILGIKESDGYKTSIKEVSYSYSVM